MAKENSILESCISKYKEEIGDLCSNLEDSDIFEMFAAEQILKDYDLDMEEISSGLVGGGGDNGIDGIYVFLDNELLNDPENFRKLNGEHKLVIHLHQYKNSYKISETVLSKFSDAINDITDVSNKDLKGWNEDCISKIELIRSAINNFAAKAEVSFEIRYASKGNEKDIDGNESHLQKALKLEDVPRKNNMSAVTVNYSYVGAETLISQYRRVPNYELELKIQANTLISEYSSGDEQEARIGYVVTTLLKDYIDFIVDEQGALKTYLFDANVRDFQNNTDVNRQIKEVLNNKDDEVDFWWLNNGVTLIANDAKICGSKIILSNIQIVNGLQTSYTIFNVYNSSGVEVLGKRSLLVKIITSKEKKDIDRVIRATNSQNPINSGVLRASDDIQRDIETFFESNGLYYDRRKNYHKNNGKNRDKIISIKYLAQISQTLLVSDKNASIARSNPASLLRDDESYSRLFDSKFEHKSFFNSVLLAKAVDKILKELEKELKESKKKITKAQLIDQELVKYFKFHILYIVVSTRLKKSHFGANDISKIDVSVDSDIVNQAINILREIVAKYRKTDTEYKQMSLTNISKNKKFGEYLISNIEEFINIKSI